MLTIDVTYVLFSTKSPQMDQIQKMNELTLETALYLQN